MPEYDENVLENETEVSLAGLRDALRSARRWRELLSDADRRMLLADIARVGLVIARDLSPCVQDLDIGDANTQTAASPMERLAFLKTTIPRVLAAVARLHAEPPAALRVAARDVPLEWARRISPAALRDLARKPPAISGTNRVQETVFLPTNDTIPVRAAKTIVATFARDVSMIAELAREGDAPAAAADAERLRAHLQIALRHSFWRDLPPLPRVPPLPLTLRASGVHCLLHDAYNRYRRGFAWDWSHPLFRLASRETWLLYEYWCVFMVVEAARSLGFRASGETDVVRIGRSGVALSLATNSSSRVVLWDGGRAVTIRYQSHFPRARSGTPGFHSRASAMTPDITLEHDGRILILDAKFKTYAERDTAQGPGVYLSALDDLRQLHSYRDAIRSGDEQPVRAAWGLYPGRVGGRNRAVIAFPELLPTRPFGNGEVGAILLRPGKTGGSTLAALVAAFLGGQLPQK